MSKRDRKLLRRYSKNGYIIHEDINIVVIATGFSRKSKNSKTGGMIQTWILRKGMDPNRAVKTGNDYMVCGNCPLRPALYKAGIRPASDYADAKALGWRAFVKTSVRVKGLAVCPASEEAIADRESKGIFKTITCETCGLCKGNSLQARDIQIIGHGPNPDVCYVRVGDAPLAVWRAFKRGRYARLIDLGLVRGRAVRFGSYGDPVLIPLPIIRALASVAENHTGYTHQWRKPTAQAYRDFLMASCSIAA